MQKVRVQGYWELVVDLHTYDRYSLLQQVQYITVTVCSYSACTVDTK